MENIKCKDCLHGMPSKYAPRQQYRADETSLNEVLECICFGQFRAADLPRSCEEFVNATEEIQKRSKFDPDVDSWSGRSV